MTNAASASEIAALVSWPHQYLVREQVQQSRMQAKRITNTAMSLMPVCQSNEREQHGTIQSTRDKKRFVLLTGPRAIAFACPSHVPWQDHIDHLPKSRTSVSPQKLVKQKMKKSGSMFWVQQENCQVAAAVIDRFPALESPILQSNCCLFLLPADDARSKEL